MSRILISCFSASVLASIFSIATATAAVFERDWKTPGDGLLSYDDVNQREWLDLTETQLFKFPGTTLDERFQSVLSETSVGGMFEGFTASAGIEVLAFAESAGIDTSIDDFSINGPPSSALIDLLGATSTFESSRWSIGVINETDDSERLIAGAYFIQGLRGAPIAGFGIGVMPQDYHGVWLYRLIPEPSTEVMFALMFVLTLTKHRRENRNGKG